MTNRNFKGNHRIKFVSGILKNISSKYLVNQKTNIWNDSCIAYKKEFRYFFLNLRLYYAIFVIIMERAILPIFISYFIFEFISFRTFCYKIFHIESSLLLTYLI